MNDYEIAVLKNGTLIFTTTEKARDIQQAIFRVRRRMGEDYQVLQARQVHHGSPVNSVIVSKLASAYTEKYGSLI